MTNIKFAKLNVDENPSTPRMFGVTGIPTLLMFKNGEYADRIVGYMPKSKMAEKLKKLL